MDFSSLPVPANLPDDDQVAIGAPTDKPKIPEAEGAAAAALQAPKEVVTEFRRADGTAYDAPPGKQISEHPLVQITVEVDEEGEPVAGKPRYERQFVDKAWRRTWKSSPRMFLQLDAGKAEDLQRLNDLYAETEPPGAPQVVIESAEVQFTKNTGSFIWMIRYRRITYFNVLKVR